MNANEQWRTNGGSRISQKNIDERLSYGLGWFSIGLGLAELIAPDKMAGLIGAADGDRSRKVMRAYGVREIAAGVGILSQPTTPAWLWTRVAGDMLDLSSMFAAMGSKKSDRARLIAAAAAVAGVTALDIYCGQKLNSRASGDGTKATGRIRLAQTIIVDRPVEQVYRYWRNFENFPNFMDHLQSVQVTGERESHWKANAPAGKTVEWDAEITEDEPNSRIGWRSLPGSDVDHSGAVRFERATGDRGTLIRVELEYDPPAGKAGAWIAKLFRENPKQQIYDDLRAFKQIMETGHKAKSDASIHTGMHAAQPPQQAPEMVEEYV